MSTEEKNQVHQPGRVFGIQHSGSRRARGGAQTSRHVHRGHRGERTAPPGLRGGRQLDRRGAGRILHRHRRHDQRGRLDHRARQRPGHSDRLPRKGGTFGAGGRADRTARRRKVQQGQLQGLGRSARRGRIVRQRALDAAHGRGAPAGPHFPPAIQPRHAAGSDGSDRRNLGGGSRNDHHVQARRHDFLGHRIRLRDAARRACANWHT